MKYLVYIISLYCLCACSVARPKDFSYQYDDKELTGLSKKINIEGCYVIPYECDTAFYTVALFYPDGLFLSATTSRIEPVAACFSGNNPNTKICNYPSWGLYVLNGDTIKTQTIRVEGIATCTIFRDYLIQTDGSLINISDYVNPAKTNIGYMRKYPSFTNNPCKKTAAFTPLELRLAAQACPFLHLKWFKKQ